MGDTDETSRNYLNSYTPVFEHSDENPAWKCRHESGPGVRNLVVCIDGTANQFGRRNTNVIELYHLIRKEVGSNQLTWYNSGIGTYARPSWKSLEYYRQVIDHGIDLAIAWNFDRTILAAYRWLSDNYQDGDRIFLFGFSRGAFQVRVLAAMIDKVGLIHKGNEEQIPFAYALYADPESGVAKNGVSMAKNFKATFSHEKADVHYVGVWDTVSSIGIARGKHLLPGTVDGMKHVCYFRHALALDERRVKFAPEYAYGGSTTGGPPGFNASRPNETSQHNQTQQNSKPDGPPQTLEVWFAGTHSDIGGGNVQNESMNRNRPPLRWMVFESVAAGLRTKPFQRVLSSEEQIEVKESLAGGWLVLECLPLNRLTYTRKKGGNPTTYKPHMGKARKIHDGQKIHHSLILTNKRKDEYTPKARPLNDDSNFWENFRTKGLGKWKAVDLFEGTQDLLKIFLDRQDDSVWELLRRTAMTVDGRRAVYEGTVGALRITNTTPKPAMSTKLQLISNIMTILDHPELMDTPWKKSGLDNVIMAFEEFRESEDETDVSIVKKFLCQFTTFKPRFEVNVGPDWPILNVSVSPGSTRIVSGLLDYSIRSWDTSTEPPIVEDFQGHRSVVNVVLVSPDGGLVVSGSRDGTVRLWKTNASSSSAAALLQGHTESVNSLAISPDGMLVASGSHDNTVRIWSVDGRKQVGKPLTGHGGTVCAVGFAGNGTKIVSCSNDKTVRVWDVKTHDPVAKPLVLGDDQDWVLSAALSSDGKRLAAGFSDESVRVWDLEERVMVGEPFRLHRTAVCSAAFSPDGRRIISGSSDGTVLVWDAETQKAENHFQHGKRVGAVVFCPDGKSVVTGCDDGIIRRWSTEPWN